MGKFFGQEIKKTGTKLTSEIVQIPSGSFLKLGGQGFTISQNLQTSLLVSGLGGVEAGSVIPTYGIMFLFIVRSGGANFATLSSSNTSVYPSASFMGFVQINNSNIFDVSGTDAVFSSNWVSDGVIRFEATVTNPTKGTMLRDNVKYRRKDNFIEVIYDFFSSSAGSNGSGEYIIKTPFNMPMNLALVDVDTTAFLGGYGNPVRVPSIGTYSQGKINTAGSDFLSLNCIPYDQEGFRVIYNGQNINNTTVYPAAGLRSASFPIFGGDVYWMNARVEYPVLGWMTQKEMLAML